MADNEWVVDGHHYTCPDCKKTIAIVVNESDEGFEFCPFCGKRMSGQMTENKMEAVARLFGKELGEPFIVVWNDKKVRAMFDKQYLSILNFGYGWHTVQDEILRKLITGEAVIVDE